jgi:hypothetical protein
LYNVSSPCFKNIGQDNTTQHNDTKLNENVIVTLNLTQVCILFNAGQ